MDWTIFFKVFLSYKEIFFDFYDLIPPEIFNNAIQTNLFLLIHKFGEKYKKFPDFNTLVILLDDLPATEKENRKAYIEFIEKVKSVNSEVDTKVFSEQLSKALQDYEIEKFILKTANQIGRVTLDSLVTDIKGIISKFTPKSAGIDVTDVDKVMHYIRPEHAERISTGIEELDKSLYGGYGSDEITIVMAPPGRGKSFFLLNAMFYAILSGKSALYITLELSEKSVVRRLYSRVTYSSRKDMLEEQVIAQRAKKFFKLVDSFGKVVYYPGNTITVTEIEGLLERQMLHFGFKPDILIIDYLDRLAPRKTDYRREVRHQLRNITDDLRSLATAYSIPVVTATQANRISLSKKKITEAHVAEAFGKIEVADVVVALCQTEEEKAIKKARLVVLKNRDYISGSEIDFYCDFEKMMLCDMEQAYKLGLLMKPVAERVIK